MTAGYSQISYEVAIGYDSRLQSDIVRGKTILFFAESYRDVLLAFLQTSFTWIFHFKSSFYFEYQIGRYICHFSSHIVSLSMILL